MYSQNSNKYLEIIHLQQLKWNWTSPRGHKEPSPFGVHLPNIHTSLAEVNRRKLIDSGAIHLMGNFPLEATGKARKGRLLSPLQISKTDFVPNEVIHKQNQSQVKHLKYQYIRLFGFTRKEKWTNKTQNNNNNPPNLP